MKHVITLGLTTLLAACQGTQGDSWFPLVEGSAQVYEVRVTSEEAPPVDEWTLRVEGPRSLNDQPVMVRHHSAGVGYFLQTDDTGVKRVATQMDIDSEPTPDKEPMWVLKAPYVVGTEWTTPTVPYLILRRNEHPRELRYSHKALMYWRIEAVDDSVHHTHRHATSPACAWSAAPTSTSSPTRSTASPTCR